MSGVEIGPETGDELEPRRRSERSNLRRAGSLLIALVIVAFKVEALGHVLHDGATDVFVIFGVTAVGALLRGRPLTCSAAIAVIVAVALRPHPWLAGVAVGALVFVALAMIGLLGSWVASRIDGDEPGFGGGWLT